MICPVCRTNDNWTAIRRIFVDGVWRAYRRHRACGTAVAIAVRMAVA